MPKQRDFVLRTEYITLGQLLKAAGIVSTGGEGKEMIASGELTVNGEAEDRRGRKLRPNDVVQFPDGSEIRIGAPA